jgi:hypothetical protein
MSLPTINSLESLLPMLKIWQQTINPAISVPPIPRSPFNFRAMGGATGTIGIALSWEQVAGADGYQIQSSPTGDFSTAPIVATLSSISATSFFDNTIVTGVKRWYRIRSTSGTIANPQSVQGTWTAPIYATSGSGTTTYDTVSSSTGINNGNRGWNNNVNPGFGPRPQAIK